MRRRALLGAALAGLCRPAHAQGIGRVLPAGPPAAVLLWSLAPELMTGWVRRPGPAALDFMPPAAASLPVSGRLTGRDGAAAAVQVVESQRPDLVLDYGSIAPAYVALADRIQAQTGRRAVLLDGSLTLIPETYRVLGEMLDRQPAARARAEVAQTILDEARAAAALLQQRGRPRVSYARGSQGMDMGMGPPMAAEVLELAGAELLPPGAGPAAGADWVITDDPGFLASVRTDPAWAATSAVQAGHVALAPSLPYGWLDEPPSVNRLAGLLWLPVLFGVRPRDGFPARLAALYGMLYGAVPSGEKLRPLLRGALTL